MGSPIVIGALVAVLGLVVYKLLGGLGDAKFVIKVRGDGEVDVRGEAPGLSLGEVVEFVRGLELPAGAKISGVPDRGKITLRFSGDIPENLKQRMRNFFYNAI